ncbi:MAG: serine hydrolase [Saprospiraceae bacterium]|nr:serine hydrolase [Saprospiraceae bacterium]
MKKFKTLITLTIILFISHSLLGQGISSKQIDSLVSKAFKLSPSVGIAITVVKDGEVIHAKGYGVTSIKTKKKVDENTLFAIASNSKAFTTAALSILVDEGKLNWQDKVVDYIPEFKMYDDYITANFNIEDLLTHRSGLGLGAGDLMFFPDGGNFTINDVLKSFQYQTPTSAFRTKYDYDNLLYIVAGELIKRVSGLSWAEFVQIKIFNPLEMNRSTPVNSGLEKDENIAFPHRSYGGEIVQLETYNGGELLGAAGGIYSSANDISKWLLLQLNGGKYGKDLSKKMFSEQRQREMWYPHTMVGFNVNPNSRTNTHLSAYGLGWDITDKKGKFIVQHTGGLPGMLSRTILVPELNLGIVVLTNSDPGGYGFYSIPETILDSYLSIEPQDWIALLAERAKSNNTEADSVTNAVWETVKKNKSTKIDLNNFVGTYNDDWFGEVEISLKNEKLWFTSKRSPKLNGQMFFYKATTFAVKWEYTDMPCDAFATFNLNEEGKAISIKMKGISPNIDFSFDFHDLNLVKVDK